MKRSGPDSLHSWVISFACCFINMMMFGMIRMSGVLFIASTSRFNVSRKMASLPFTFACFMRNTSGPLVGFLGNRYGVRPVTIFGCLLGAIGVGACYFAENINTVTVLWGATYGLGFGLGSILLPVSINQYFHKHRATASGISFSGACLGSFVLPPIVDILLNTYGLSGTFLLLSGFILNCIPVSLLLKKPSFNIDAKPFRCEQTRRQSIKCGKNVMIYTVQNHSQRSQAIQKDDTEIGIVREFKDKDKNGCNLDSTHHENMKVLATQVYYSSRTGISKPLDVEQILPNLKARRTVVSDIHKEEFPSLPCHKTDDDTTLTRDEVVGHDCRLCNIQCVRPAVRTSRTQSLSSDHVIPRTDKSICTENQAYLNYGFNTEVYEVSLKSKLEIPQNTRSKFTPCSYHLPSEVSAESSVNHSFLKNCNIFKYLAKKMKNPSNNRSNFPKNCEGSDFADCKEKNEIVTTPQVKGFPLIGRHGSLSSCSVLLNPVFHLITITNAIYCFTFICMITIIVDFSRDLHIGQHREKYVIMSLSVGGLIGRLGLGWITDRGFMTTTGFAALCFACKGMTSAAVAWSSGFPSLIILVTLYGLSEAGIMIIYPIIISQYVDYDKQTFAVPSSNFLSGPLCLAVAPMIGYFRDEIGSYDYIFYGLAFLSGACSLSLLLIPCITKYHRQSR